jgi:hypothetical protein
MARRIILKEDGLGSGNTPSGYKFIGYNNNSLSERLSNGNINPIGGSLSDVKTLTVNLNLTQINNLSGATVSVPFSSFDAVSGESISILTTNTLFYVNSDGITFSTGITGGLRLNSGTSSVLWTSSQASIQTDGTYIGSGSATSLQKLIPNGDFYLSTNSPISGGGTNSQISVTFYYQTYI